MLNHFTFNGHSTGELGLLVSGINIYGSPSRVVEKVNIPYRSGDLIIDTGAYTNYMLTYTVDIMDNTKATAEAISKWLLGSKGYCELTDTYNPEIYRVASYYNQLDYTLSALYRYGKATITFDCKPQKYLTANQPVSLSSTLSEETSYSLSTPAMPLPLTLEGNTTQGANPTPEAPQEIHSVKGDNEIRMVGFNIWDEVTANGYYGTNGAFTPNASYIASKNKIPLLPSTQYCITSLKGNLGRICFYNADGTFNSTIVNYVGATVTKYTFTTNADVYFMAFDMRSGYGTTYTNDICINVSDTEKNGTYEPYRSQVYPINLPVENLCPPLTVGIGINATNGVETQSGISATSDYIAVNFNVNPSYYLSGLDDGLHSFVYSYDASKQPLHRTGAMNREEIKLTSAEFTGGTATGTGDIAYVRVTQYWLSGDNGDISDVPSLPIQLEVGDVPSTYNPYGSPSIELNALGTYKDYFHKTDGKWYLHKETGEVDLGTLTWAKSSSGNKYSTTITPPYKWAGNDVMLCSSYTFDGIGNSTVGYYGANGTFRYGYNVSSSTSYSEMYFANESISTQTDFKTSVNGVLLYYPLQTATNTEITNSTLISQLNAISKAKTYDGSTTIVQEGTDAQFKLSMPVPAEVTSEYKGEPIITVSEVGTIVWNDSLIKVNSAPVTINSQTLQCYYYSENKNNDVEINEFPKYEQGDNYIGSTMALTVVPNYWKL